MHDDRLLTPGQTCWRTARADKFAPIIDAADYFKHVKAAMLRARHRLMLIGWDFDSRVLFERVRRPFQGQTSWAPSFIGCCGNGRGWISTY